MAVRGAAGLAVAADGYRLVLDRDQLRAGERGTLGFRIVGADGETVDDFERSTSAACT